MLRHITGLGYLLQGWLVAESAACKKQVEEIESQRADIDLISGLSNAEHTPLLKVPGKIGRWTHR
ncbi:hypothetical protein ES703_26848 [subsurface metagenome]